MDFAARPANARRVASFEDEDVASNRAGDQPGALSPSPSGPLPLPRDGLVDGREDRDSYLEPSVAAPVDFQPSSDPSGGGAIEFSLPVELGRGLALRLPEIDLIASVRGRSLSVHSLPNLSLEYSSALPYEPQSITSTMRPPHTLALSSQGHVSLFTVSTDISDNCSAFPDFRPPVHISLPHTPVRCVVMSPSAAVVLHAFGLGASIFPLHFQRSGLQTPVFLPEVGAPPPASTSHPCLPSTAALSPCGRFLALSLKSVTGDPGVRVVSLPDGNTRAEGVGSKALGGKITDVAGIRWLASPQNAILVWGQPVDGPDALCLLGIDCSLIQMGMPDRVSVSPDAGVSSSLVSTPSRNRKAVSREARTGADINVLEEDLRDTYRDLGIKNVAVSFDGGILAIGGHDGVLRLVNALTWRRIAAWNMGAPCVDEKEPPTVYVERELVSDASGDENEHRNTNPGHARTRRRKVRHFDAVDGLGEIVVTKRKIKSVFSGVEDILNGGVGLVQFSPDGRWLCARSDSTTNVLFIIDTHKACIVNALVLTDDIQSASWSAQTAGGGTKLAVTSDGENIYFWCEAGAAVVQVPDGLERESVIATASKNRRYRGKGRGFRASRVTWPSGDDALLAVDGAADGSFCVVYVD